MTRSPFRILQGDVVDGDRFLQLKAASAEKAADRIQFRRLFHPDPDTEKAW